MSAKKYVSDYRLDYQLKPGGGLRGVPVYIGSYYTLKADPQEISRLKPRLAILAGLSLALLISQLFLTPFLQGGFTLLAIPMAFALIPTWLICRAVWLLHTVKLPATREKKDKISNSFPAGTLFLMVLSAAVLLGLLAQMIVFGFRLPTVLYGLDAAALALCGVLLFRRRNALEMELVPEET